MIPRSGHSYMNHNKDHKTKAKFGMGSFLDACASMHARHARHSEGHKRITEAREPVEESHPFNTHQFAHRGRRGER